MPDYKWNSVQDFANSVREKYPVYKDWSDADLTRAMFEKFPSYIPQVKTFETSYKTNQPGDISQPSSLEKLGNKVQGRLKNPLTEISSGALKAQEAAVARGDVPAARLHSGVATASRLTNELVTDPTNLALGAISTIPAARLAMAPVMGGLGLYGMIKSGTNIGEIGQQSLYSLGLSDTPSENATPEAAQKYLQGAAMLSGAVTGTGEKAATEPTARTLDKIKEIYVKSGKLPSGKPGTPYVKTAAKTAGSVAGAVGGYTAGSEVGHPYVGGYIGRRVGANVGEGAYELGKSFLENMPKALRSKAFEAYQDFLNKDIISGQAPGTGQTGTPGIPNPIPPGTLGGPGGPSINPGAGEVISPKDVLTNKRLAAAKKASIEPTPNLPPEVPPASRVQSEFTPEGNIRLGGANERGWKIMGGSLYKDRSPKTVVKELLQNAFDAVRGADNGIVHVDMNFKYPEIEQKNPVFKEIGIKEFDYNNGRPVLTVSDTGKGMTHQQVGTVLTNIFESGKGADTSASGGFGVAKAAIFNIPEHVRVETTTKLTKGRYQTTTFEGTFDQLISEKGVKPTVKTKLDPFNKTRTGTTIEATLPKGSTFYNTEQFVEDTMNKSLNPPGQLTSQKYNGGVKSADASNRPTELMHETDIGGTNIKIYKSKEQDSGLFSGYGLNVEVNNKGIYQFTTQVPIPGELSGIPRRIAVDINTTHPEESTDYPFSASREALKDSINKKVNEVINEEIIKPAYERTNNLVDQVYNSLPNITDNTVVYDAGGRLTPEEMQDIQNNPVVRELANHLQSMGSDLLSTLSVSREIQAVHSGRNPFGQKIDRWGFVLSDAVHGVNISNKGLTSQTVLINPFSSKQMTPSGVASMMFHTLKHEINHEAISGHNASFTTSLAHIDENVPIDKTIDFLTRLKETLSAPDGKLHPDYLKARQIYSDSRMRPSTGKDIFAKDIDKEGRGY